MLSRREFIVTTGIGGSTLLAGCIENSQSSASDDLEPPLLGDPESSIVVDVYADYQCSHCADFKRNSYPILKDEYIDTGVIAYRHRDFPFLGTLSTQSANVARGVQDSLGNDKFWEFSTQMLENQDQLSSNWWRNTISELGGDGPSIVNMALNGAWSSIVDADFQYGQQLGVKGTPAVAINDQLVPRSSPTYAQDVIEYIERIR